MTAVQQVFNTNELLEAILLHLPIHDLLLGTHVCQQWCAHIQESTAIHKAMIAWRMSDNDEMPPHPSTATSWVFHSDHKEGTLFVACEPKQEISILASSDPNRSSVALRRGAIERIFKYRWIGSNDIYRMHWYDRGGRQVLEPTISCYTETSPVIWHYCHRFYVPPEQL